MSQLKSKKKEMETANSLLEKQRYESQNELQQTMEENEVETLFGSMSVRDCLIVQLCVTVRVMFCQSY